MDGAKEEWTSALVRQAEGQEQRRRRRTSFCFLRNSKSPPRLIVPPPAAVTGPGVGLLPLVPPRACEDPVRANVRWLAGGAKWFTFLTPPTPPPEGTALVARWYADVAGR